MSTGPGTRTGVSPRLLVCYSATQVAASSGWRAASVLGLVLDSHRVATLPLWTLVSPAYVSGDSTFSLENPGRPRRPLHDLGHSCSRLDLTLFCEPTWRGLMALRTPQGVGSETEAPRGTEPDTGADSDSLPIPLSGQPHQGSSPTQTL